jgi:hypothetical protein
MGYVEVVAERLVTCFWAVTTPAGTLLRLPDAALDEPELLLDPHPANTANAATNAALGISHRLPMNIISHSSKPLRSTTVV